MLIAEALLLLLTDDDTGKLCAPAFQVDLALAGANLTELALLDRIGVIHEAADGNAPRVMVRDTTPTGDPILDESLARLDIDGGTKPEPLLKALATDLRTRLYERLATRGIVRADRRKTLGLFPRNTWPTEDVHHETGIRQSIIDAVIRPSSCDDHTAAVIALLHALRCDQKMLDAHDLGLSGSELESRMAAIAADNWASTAVRDSISKVLAAVIAAHTAATSTVVLPGAH